MPNTKPFLYTSLSPALLHLYEVSQATVVIIDVLRATSTIATALYNGAKHIVPVDLSLIHISWRSRLAAFEELYNSGILAKHPDMGSRNLIFYFTRDWNTHLADTQNNRSPES